MAKIEIYTKTFCGFCIRAKALLDGKSAQYDEYSVDFGGDRRSEMVQRSGGRTTVPQIFIDGRHIGGCNELMTLDQQGKLDELITA